MALKPDMTGYCYSRRCYQPRAEGQTTKANRVQATLEDTDDPDAYLDAAKVARDARRASTWRAPSGGWAVRWW